MTGITVSIDINAPIEQVWDRLSDLSSHSEWMQDAESVEFLTQRREGIGTMLRVLTRVGPLRTADILEVTEWTPPSTIAVVHRGVVAGVGRFELTATNAGTRFAWTETILFPWWAGGPIIAFLGRPILRALWKENLARFRDRF
jgi:carbon monoxide dehydrogenase subunit G